MNTDTNSTIEALDADLVATGAALDRLGRVEREAAPLDFEDRMASTARFALSAAANARASSGGHGSMLLRRLGRLAAGVAIGGVGVLAWTLTHGTPATPKAVGPVATTTGTNPETTSASPQGDDSEVFARVALALDGGTSSEIDFLLKDTSELDTKIRGSSTVTDSIDGSTM